MSTSASNTNPADVASLSSARAGAPGSAGLSAQLSSLGRQYRALPAILRLGLLAVVAVGLYALLNATAWEWARQAGGTANALQAELNKANQRQVVDPRLRSVVLAHGPIRLPQSEDQGSRDLGEAVNDVLKAHKAVEKVSNQAQQASRLQGAGLTQVLPRGAEAAKVSREIEFTAPVHVASAILIDLESHPAIDSISRLEIQMDEKERNQEPRRVKVKLTVESWVAGEPRGRRG